MFSQVPDSLALKDFQCCSSLIKETLIVRPVVSHVQSVIWIIDLIVKGATIWSSLCFSVFYHLKPLQSALCSIGKYILIRFRTTWLHTVLLCFYLADPATILSSASVPGTLFSLWEQLVYSFMGEKKCVLLPHLCRKYSNSEFLL